MSTVTTRTPPMRPEPTPVEPPSPPRPLPRRRRAAGWAVLATVVLLAPPALSTAVSATRPTTYAAQADILYRGADTTSSQSIDRELATQQVLLASRPLVDEAATLVGREPRDLADDVSVEVVDASSILRLRVVDTDSARAQRAVESLAEQYTAAVATDPASQADEQERALLATRADELAERLEAVTARVTEIAAVDPAPAALATEQRALESEAQVLRQEVATVEAQVVELDRRVLQRPGASASVVAGALVLDEPVGPQPLRAAAAGLLLGLLLLAGVVAVARSTGVRRRPSPA